MSRVTPGSGRERRSRITVRRYATAAEADRHDLEFWTQMSDGERVMEARRLSEEI